MVLGGCARSVELKRWKSCRLRALEHGDVTALSLYQLYGGGKARANLRDQVTINSSLSRPTGASAVAALAEHASGIMTVRFETQQGQGAVLGKPLHTPAAWTAPDALANPSEWQYELTPHDVEELKNATRIALSTGKPVPVSLRAYAGLPVPAIPHFLGLIPGLPKGASPFVPVTAI